ncbi:MAG: neutral/alkaline non-lysosomal ceramidase N-terminal domain-containing protein, partial [Thermoguttaceae bacterium]|nr:neutral/alkaline non-lysosomal ceramidase N-terminal domain-containing protein [Thermoguttaceae bacterium]
MRRCRNFSALLFVSVFSLISIYPLVAEEPVFECGTAQIDITPPIPFPLDGYYNERLSTDTHDPLFAKALIFKQGDKQFAVVACDNISVAQTSTDEARRRASEQTGIPVSNIVITGTHTHTGPVITELDPAATPETNRKAIENSDHKAFHYQLYFVEKVVAVIAEAQKNLKPATVRFTMSEAVGVSFNRRFFVKGSDQVVFNPGFNNPNLIRPAAGVDPQLPILLFSDA